MRILRSRSRRFGFLRSVSFCIYKTQDFQFSLCFPETRCSASLCIQRTHQHQSQSRRLGFLCSASSYSFCGVWRVVTLIAIAIFIAIFLTAKKIAQIVDTVSDVPLRYVCIYAAHGAVIRPPAKLHRDKLRQPKSIAQRGKAMPQAMRPNLWQATRLAHTVDMSPHRVRAATRNKLIRIPAPVGY